MRTTPPVLLLLVCLLVSSALSAQESASSATTPGPQTPATTTFLQQALAAMGQSTTDVTLTGTVIVSFHSVTNSGTIELIATSSGQGEVASTTSTGTRTEIRDISTGSPTFLVSGPDGVMHQVTTQSALSPNPSWFFPAFILSEALWSPLYASSYVGQEVRNGASVQHLSLAPLSTNSSFSNVATNLTRHDIYLDSSSLLPVAITFNAHPYDAANPDAVLTPYRGNPVDQLEEVDFSDCQLIQGHALAFHIHTVINLVAGPLATDIQIESVAFNTGALISAN